MDQPPEAPVKLLNFVSMSEVKQEPEEQESRETAGALSLMDGVSALPTMRDLANPLMEHRLEHFSVGADGRKDKDGEGQSLMMYGPQCWKCYSWNTWWKCQSCKKTYHKKCAFFGEEYPHPIFNVPVEDAVDAKERGASILVKCTQCIVAEKTLIPELRRIPIKYLNEIFIHVAHWMVQQFGSIMEEINDDSVVASLELIRNTVMVFPGHYKTVEGFGADYRLMMFQVIRRYGQESEQVEAMTSMLGVLQQELTICLMCWECYVRRYDAQRFGKLMPTGAFFRILEATCTVPHPIVWVSGLPNDNTSIYWPAKLLFVDEETGQLCIHCFDEKAVRNLDCDGETSVFFFSKEDPNHPSGKRVRKRKGSTQTLIKRTMISCEKYLENLEARFGVDGVVIPEKIAGFSGTYKSAFQKVFPDLDLESLLKDRNEADYSCFTIADLKME